MKEENLSSLPIWIKLPNLPIELWSDDDLKAIGDVLDTFIITDKRYKSLSYRSIAQILVDINSRLGLYEYTNIMLGDKKYTQQLDYLHLTFNCFSCHSIEHLHAFISQNF